MDIIFQSGEFYGEDNNLYQILGIIGTFLGILVGALVSIYVFWKGKKEEQNAESEKLNALEKYIKAFIRGLEVPINNQVKYIDDGIKQIENTSQDMYFEFSSSLTIDDIKWINGGQLHTLFVLRKAGDEKAKAENLRVFRESCLAVESTVDNIKKTVDFFLANVKIYEANWNKSLLTVNEGYDKYRTALEERKEKPSEFFIAFDALRAEWTKSENYIAQKVAVEKFLKPLQAAARKTKGDQFAVYTLQHINDCLHAYDNMNALHAFTIVGFNKTKELLKSAQKKLLDLMDGYDSEFKTVPPKTQSFMQYVVSRNRVFTK